MVKVLGLGFVALLLGMLPCAGMGAEPLPQAPVRQPKLLWETKVPGMVTDLNVSRDGSRVLVSTVPDHENPGASNRNWQLSLNSSGKVLWRKQMEIPVKVQTLSVDGKISVTDTHDETLEFRDAQGKLLWSAEALCRPIVFDSAKKVLCYHDDDAEPRVAFDVFDWQGHKILSFPIAQDILALKVAQDQLHFAAAMSNGQVSLFDSEFHPLWSAKTGSEVVDIAISSGETPEIAALLKSGAVVVFGGDGKIIAQGKSGAHIEQIEMTGSGRSVVGYGNSSEGQVLVSLAVSGGELSREWMHKESHNAEYSSFLRMRGARSDVAVIGLESVSAQPASSEPRLGHNRIVGFGPDGSELWELPLSISAATYLYAVGKRILVVGTDDDRLMAFRLESI